MAIRSRGGSSDTLIRKPPVKPGLVGIKPPKFVMAGTEIGGVLKEIQGAYGEEVARVLKNKSPYQERIRTGIFVLDLALAGGFLTSRGSMLYGERSAGKSTIAMLVCLEAQRRYPDKLVAWIDIEGTFDETWFKKLGGDPERLLLLEPESGEHAVDIADAVCRSLETSVVVTDSIAMLVPMKELENSAEDNMMGVHARLVGNYLRRVNSALLKERHRKHRLLVMHINQFRMKIGVMFGDPRTLPGGKALEFSTSQQVEIKNREKIQENTGIVTHNEHEFKITKDKTGGRLRTGKFLMVRDSATYKGLPEGTIHQSGSILQLGEKVGLVDGKEIKGFGKAAGKDAWMEKFLADPEMYAKVQLNIIEAYLDLWGLRQPNV
jgi:recombination protein RecA